MVANYLAKMDMKLRLCSSTSANHDRRYCPNCSNLRVDRRKEASKRAMVTKAKNNPHWVRPSHADPHIQYLAHRAVAEAKRKGFLPILDGSIACMDCGAPAREYDHRDYGRPLDVEPVCVRCNRRRGTAIWPNLAPSEKAA